MSLSDNNFMPKKSLGQHFLHDMNIARNIVSLLDISPDDVIVEIGPGKGVLTALLAASEARVLAVDIDQRAIAYLRERFPPEQYPRLELHHADILSFGFDQHAALHGARLRVLGNLPYNITSQILFRLFDHHHAIRDVVIMMQREVAARLTAAPHSKEYGILSVATQTHASVRRCFHVSPNVFRPRPVVWSTVLFLQFRDDVLTHIENYSFFRGLLRAAFGKRRKTIANALRFADIDVAGLPLHHAHLLKLRPEQLSVQDFITLSNNLHRYEQREH
jgi:16S rRNA (adenine1518-N6/adenine1519-N6)-dimethyltransferase